MSRLEARAKLGFFPLPLAEASRIHQTLEFSGRHTAVLDPCVGEGAALSIIATGPGVARYGIELDAFRAEKAREACTQLVQGNALEVSCPVESFSVLYLNPPYDWEIGDGRNRRMEVVFLEETFRWLKAGGVLILVVPRQRLAECSHIVAAHFKEVRVYELTEALCVQYRQVLLVGVRRTQRERERVQDPEIAGARANYTRMANGSTELRSLGDEPDCTFRVPESGPVKLVYRGLPLDVIEDFLPKSPAYRQAGPILFADEDPIEGRPLTPLHGGHIGLLATAGMLNGTFGEGESRHIANWQSVKVVDRSQEEEEDGTTIMREKERWANELNLAFASGKVVTLK